MIGFRVYERKCLEVSVHQILVAARNSERIKSLSGNQADGAEAYFQAYAHIAETYGDSPVELQRVGAWQYLELTASPGEEAEEDYMIGMEIGRTVLSHLQ